MSSGQASDAPGSLQPAAVKSSSPHSAGDALVALVEVRLLARERQFAGGQGSTAVRPRIRHSIHSQGYQELNFNVPIVIVLMLQASRRCTEEDIKSHLAAHSSVVVWCNSVDPGRFLVRFASKKGLETAVKSLHGSSVHGQPVHITPAAVGQLLSQQDSSG